MKKNNVLRLLAICIFGLACQCYAQETAKGQSPASVSISPFKYIYPVLDLALFPNPASSQVEVKRGVYHKEKQHVLQITDQSGRPVVNRSWQGERLDVSGLMEGMYIVTIRREQLTFSQKLIVKRK